MIVVRRRLFWKVYLTLLASLAAAAVLMGSLWWLLGATPGDRWASLRLHLAEAATARPGEATAALGDRIRRLGDEIGADISVYDRAGGMIAARGPAVTRPSGPPTAARHGPELYLRDELPDGETALVRLTQPLTRGLQAIATAVLVVAGGLGLAAFPMAARLTRNLERLRSGMERWGRGDVGARLDEGGRDEVAEVARTFNAAADRIGALMSSQRALLGNASHELRSPLARLRLAVDVWLVRPDAATRDEIVRDLAELDQLVGEILLSSRLDHLGPTRDAFERIDLLGLAAEEAARVGAILDGEAATVEGDETLLRRLIRNLLENGVQHGRKPIRLLLERPDPLAVRLTVSDAGEGIPPEARERVFAPFYRPAGRGDEGGGWGLGLSLVRQIATHHGGAVTCVGGPEGGSRFVVDLVASPLGRPHTRPALEGVSLTSARRRRR